MNDLMKNNFNGSLTWSYFLANGESSTFQWQQQLAANPIVNQFGNPSSVDALSPAPITFSFDIATNQLVLSAVPEPGSYAMLLAGLGAVGFMARRRSHS
jgi:PEP-CTERM motif